MHAYTDPHAYTDMHTHTHTNTLTRTHTLTHTLMHTYTPTQTHHNPSTHTLMHTHTPKHNHTHTHTDKHTHRSRQGKPLAYSQSRNKLNQDSCCRTKALTTSQTKPHTFHLLPQTAVALFITDLGMSRALASASDLFTFPFFRRAASRLSDGRRLYESHSF